MSGGEYYDQKNVWEQSMRATVSIPIGFNLPTGPSVSEVQNIDLSPETWTLAECVRCSVPDKSRLSGQKPEKAGSDMTQLLSK